jgi:hypothetical protein
VDFIAEPTLGSDAHAVADNQHPYHQLNRGAADAAVEWLQLRAQLLKIDKSSMRQSR